MTIRLVQCMVGAAGVWNVGDEAEFEDAEAARLCEAGIAVPVVAVAERATADDPKKEKRAK